MSIRIRYVMSGPGAFIVTAGLGILMANLIKVSFVPQEKVEVENYQINSVPEEVKLIEKREPPVLKTVNLPPLRPKLAIKAPHLPKETFIPFDDVIPVMAPMKLKRQPFTLAVSDVDSQPLVRIAPIMPPPAEKSGHCNVKFDVSANGQPINIAVIYCSASIFARASSKSVQKWKYKPKIFNGASVIRKGVETQITFVLRDEYGKILPE